MRPDLGWDGQFYWGPWGGSRGRWEPGGLGSPPHKANPTQGPFLCHSPLTHHRRPGVETTVILGMPPSDRTPRWPCASAAASTRPLRRGCRGTGRGAPGTDSSCLGNRAALKNPHFQPGGESVQHLARRDFRRGARIARSTPTLGLGSYSTQHPLISTWGPVQQLMPPNHTLEGPTAPGVAKSEHTAAMGGAGWWVHGFICAHPTAVLEDPPAPAPRICPPAPSLQWQGAIRGWVGKTTPRAPAPPPYRAGSRNATSCGVEAAKWIKLASPGGPRSAWAGPSGCGCGGMEILPRPYARWVWLLEYGFIVQG